MTANSHKIESFLIIMPIGPKSMSFPHYVSFNDITTYFRYMLIKQSGDTAAFDEGALVVGGGELRYYHTLLCRGVDEAVSVDHDAHM